LEPDWSPIGARLENDNHANRLAPSGVLGENPGSVKEICDDRCDHDA
jgi:hypothetical protein